MLTYLMLGFGVTMLTGSLWLVRRTLARRNSLRTALDDGNTAFETALDAGQGTAPESQKDTGPGAERESLHRSRELIRGLLHGVSRNVRTLLDELDDYKDSLNRHESAVQKAQTLAALEEVERLLLSEISGMRSTSDVYRKQLDEANRRIAEQEEELERLSEEASIDHLTRVANRRALEKRVQEELNRADREKSPFAIVLLDIDRFKAVNDTYGHLHGDEVLRLVAQCLVEHCREYDMVARYGGEEFALLLPGTSLKEAGEVAEKLRARIAATQWQVMDIELPITLSGGVSQVRSGSESASEIFGRADRALYLAKNSGRNRIVLEA